MDTQIKPPMPIYDRPGLIQRKRTKPILGVVLHHTGTQTANNTFNVLKQRGYGTNYEIDRDGTVYMYVNPDQYYTDHAGHGFNHQYIGIDITGPVNKTFTEQQISSLISLLKFLSQKYNFPLVFANWGYNPSIKPGVFKGILAHANIDPKKSDPSYTVSTKDANFWNNIKSLV